MISPKQHYTSIAVVLPISLPNIYQFVCSIWQNFLPNASRKWTIGFEPVGEFDVTADGDCSCDFRQGWRAALALQNDGSRCPDMAAIDADLQCVVLAWSGLPEHIRRAILVLIGDRPAGCRKIAIIVFCRQPDRRIQPHQTARPR